MSNNNNSGSNRMEVPEAKEAMKRFKEEVASHKSECHLSQSFLVLSRDVSS